jgi:hypothetical protein
METFYTLCRDILLEWKCNGKKAPQENVFKNHFMPILMFGAETYAWTKAGIVA